MRIFYLIIALFSTSGSLLASKFELSKQERDKLKKETVYAIDLIQSYHYKQTPFVEIDSKELLIQNMEDWDSGKLFFTQEDQQFILDRFGDSLKPSYLYIGDLYPAFEIYNTYYDRVMERLAWIQSRIQKPFDLENNQEYHPDRRDMPFPADTEEANKFWEQRLKNELIVELLEGETQEKALEKMAKRYERIKKFVDEIEVHNVQETFLSSLAMLYDPHSNFFSWDSAQEFQIQISNSLVGIGAQLRDIDGYCVIERLMPGGPAEMSGRLHPGDKIIAVAQGDGEAVDVVGMKLRKIVQMIRGESGSRVVLTVVPAQSAKRKNVSLIRETIELTANLAQAEVISVVEDDRTLTVGVINLPSFYGEGIIEDGKTGTSRDVEELINKLRDYNIDGLVLDLRNNGGGLLDEAVKLTGLFIPEGPVVLKRTFSGKIEQDWDRDPKLAYTGPLVVLVSKASASASEIVAGALQAHGRAIVVGDPSTHGKGTVQAPIDLRNVIRRLPLGAPLEVGTVKITTQKFFLPNGDSTQNRGVIADISLPSANMFLLDGEADLDHALAWDSIDSVDFKLGVFKSNPLTLIDKSRIDLLKAKSLQRQNQLEEFQFLKKNVDWYRQRHEDKSVSLNLEIRKAEKEEFEILRNEYENKIDELSERLSFDRKAIKLELTAAKENTHQKKLLSSPLPSGESRINKFYQKVFYYQESPSEKVHEIWVEYFDYEKALKHTEEFVSIFPKKLDVSIEDIESILTQFKNKDSGTDFDVTDPFKNTLGDRYDNELVDSSLSRFFTKMVEIDPDMLLNHSKLDIPLRESVRIIGDWIELENSLKKNQVANNINPTKNGNPKK